MKLNGFLFLVYYNFITIPNYLFATQYHIHIHSCHNNTIRFPLLIFTYFYLRSV
jgi:hypothetical protein